MRITITLLFLLFIAAYIYIALLKAQLADERAALKYEKSKERPLPPFFSFGTEQDRNSAKVLEDLPEHKVTAKALEDMERHVVVAEVKKPRKKKVVKKKSKLRKKAKRK